MENATKAILLGAGVVITLVLVSLGFLLLNRTTDGINDQMTAMEMQRQQALEQKFTKYDGLTVSGSDVRRALKEFEDDEIAVVVVTRIGGQREYYCEIDDSTNRITSTSASAYISETEEKTSNYYINPSGKFKATVLRDDNDTITGILFEQQ